MVPEKDNLTLSCLVSQRKRSGSVLILRWFFSPLDAPAQVAPSPPAPQQPTQFLIAKTGIKKLKLYGNYTRRFPKLKFRLYEDREGEVYRLCIRDVTATDQGFYSCRVQEIRRLRNTWRASSNGSSTTQLTGRPQQSWASMRFCFFMSKCQFDCGKDPILAAKVAQFQEVWGDPPPPAAVLFVLTRASETCIGVSEVLTLSMIKILNIV